MKINHLQHVAVEQSRLHIPILFAYDTIHGYRTIFPIPLGAASSFDPQVAHDRRHAIGARESAAVGLKQVYSPMVDVSHEPRWGRIAEGSGEDPYLGSVMAAARVKGDQGTDYSAPDKVVASVKHFAAYGQPEGGRDYNTTDMSEQRLRNLYLPPFKAAVDAGADTVDVLVQRDQRRARAAPTPRPRPTSSRRSGASTASSRATTPRWPRCAPARRRTRTPGRAVTASRPTARDAARCALNAGTDSEMVSTYIRDYGAQLLAQRQDHDGADRRRGPAHPAGEVPRRPVRAPVRRRRPRPSPAQLHAGRRRGGPRGRGAASMVLLKNDNATLPLDPTKKTAVIGPLGDDQHDMLGPWWGQGRDADAVTVLDGIKAQSPGADVRPGAARSPTPSRRQHDPDDVCGSTPASPRRWPPRRRPTRSCSRSARPAR